MMEFLVSFSEWSSSLPTWLTATATLVSGFLGASLLRILVSKFLVIIKLDKAGEKTGLTEFLRKGKVAYSPSKLIGTMVFWVILLITFFSASKLLDIAIVESLYESLVAIFPGLLAASFIIGIGAFFSVFLGNFVLTIARNAASPHAELMGTSIKYVGFIIVGLIALDQIGLGKSIVTTMFIILLAAASFGFALAFGLGCQDMAREAMKRFLDKLRERGSGGQKGDLEG